MVQYSYDEGGAMSSYFVLTFLSLFLIPVTLSFVVGGQSQYFNSWAHVSAHIDPEHVRLAGCQCQPCIQHREEIRKSNKRTILHPQVGAK